jgi:hypothetical protein
MLGRLRNLFRKAPSPLRGAPKVRREKSYTAESGYVYQYHYLGYREAARKGVPGLEYLFRVSSDRAGTFQVIVFLGRDALEPWQKANGRELAPAEQYAIVKLSLFQAFDQRGLATGDSDVVVQPHQVEEHVTTLDL